MHIHMFDTFRVGVSRICIFSISCPVTGLLSIWDPIELRFKIYGRAIRGDGRVQGDNWTLPRGEESVFRTRN